ncbi:aKG-HExxH-type peptide beta-hydroxylase [Streptomyces sp. bgisy154]|uniref:aKG-HExxH-type peptide beta-hydroxylase n=1 Tax=Streptomyces sp. bgisy154 TaxID=3413794 RepID=UPI003D715E03
MIFPPLTDFALAELGGTGGGPDTLALLVRDQDTRRLLLLRAVLEAVERADPVLCPPAARERLLADWDLLAEAEALTASPGTGHPSPARTALGHPLLGPWARRCLRGLAPPGSRPAPAERVTRPRSGPTATRTAPHAAPPAAPRTLGPGAAGGPGTAPGALSEPGVEPDVRRRELADDLAHFSAVAAAAAARAHVAFAVRLTARGGRLVLPSLGALHTERTGPVAVDAVYRRGRLTLRRPGASDVVVHLEGAFGAWSDARAWTPAYALPGLLPGGAPLPLDDLDPYRGAHGDPQCYGLTGPATLDHAERKHWLGAWSGTAAALRLGGERRLTEAAALLRCLVPLAPPGGASDDERARGSCSATRREAFGAVLSSTPPDAARLAATLVHELHHAKLAALGDMVPLHHADGRARHFAPWRPDPRPYDGLLQGAYAHLALADFHQRRALDGTDRARLDTDWGQFARLHAQVGAALPALVGSEELTWHGRRLVEIMVETHARMGERPAPRAHTVRAREYVRAARRLWSQRFPDAVGAPVP